MTIVSSPPVDSHDEERPRQLVRRIEQLPREEQDAKTLVIRHALAAADRGQRGSTVLLRLTRLGADLRRAGLPSVDAAALHELSQAGAVLRPAT